MDTQHPTPTRPRGGPPSASALRYTNGVLHVEELPVSELAATFGTPLYVYSASVLRERYRTLSSALQGLAPSVLVCFALKANANPVIGSMLAELGAGADVVSGGEIYLARRMGFQGDRIVFAGVGKTRAEMAEALEAGVRSFHVESAPELLALAEVAQAQSTVAAVAIRVNPDVQAHTHPYITTGTRADKFGVPPDVALDLLRLSARHRWLKPVGLHAHIGSQLQEVQPIVQATARLLELWDRLATEGISLSELDIGGGLGIAYHPDERPEGPDILAAALRPLLAGRKLQLVVEPGRYLLGPAGALLTTVLYNKNLPGEDKSVEFAAGAERSLVIVDVGMNDLIRPALYGAWHPVYPSKEEHYGTGAHVDLVGPVCESSDVLARERRLGPAAPGDVLAIGQTGAYGFSMASQYNARPRPAEVMVSGKEAILIRRRETYDDLWAIT